MLSSLAAALFPLNFCLIHKSIILKRRAAMIRLKKEIGSGRHFYCHPQGDSKCIKIFYNSADGDLKEVKRETGHYRKRARQITRCRFVPDFYGTVKTDRRKGYAFDIIKDYAGNISKTLEHYLQNNSLSQVWLENKRYDLRNDLIAHNIATMNLKDYNILYRRIGYKEGYLFVIDKIGDSEFIPVASLFNFLHRRKIDRIFSLFLQAKPSGNVIPAAASSNCCLCREKCRRLIKI